MATNFAKGLRSRGVPVEALSRNGQLWGASFFVDAGTGRDGNTGLDIDNPLLTISQAITNATASLGDTIYIRNGAYAEDLTMSKADVHLVGETRDGVVVTGVTNAADVCTVTGADCSISNISFRGFDTGSDITHIAVDANNCVIDNCHFTGNENQIEVTTVNFCVIKNCSFVTPDDVTNGIGFRFEDANDCKVLNCDFNFDTASDAIVHHDADRLEVAYCSGAGDDDTSASAASFILIAGSDATSQIMVHNNNITLWAALITEVSTAVAAHGLGTADLAVSATVDTSIEVLIGIYGNEVRGCTLLFDTSE